MDGPHLGFQDVAALFNAADGGVLDAQQAPGAPIGIAVEATEARPTTRESARDDRRLNYILNMFSEIGLDQQVMMVVMMVSGTFAGA